MLKHHYYTRERCEAGSTIVPGGHQVPYFTREVSLVSHERCPLFHTRGPSNQKTVCFICVLLKPYCSREEHPYFSREEHPYLSREDHPCLAREMFKHPYLSREMSKHPYLSREMAKHPYLSREMSKQHPRCDSTMSPVLKRSAAKVAR